MIQLMRIVNKPAIQEAISHGIPILIQNGTVAIPEGFYKSCGVVFQLDDLGRLIAHTRYDRKDIINNFDDLVKLNFYWWNYSKNRYESWMYPERLWLRHFYRLNLYDKNEISKEKINEY